MVQTTMYPGINNSPQTSLTAGITATDTTIPVAAVEGVFPAGPNLATIGVDEEAEVIRYQSISGYTLVGCERGFDGTTAKPWNQNELIYRGFTKYDHNSFKANIEDLSLNKLDATGDGSDVTAAFSAAASRTNIATGEKLSAIFGKIAKYFADLKALSFKDTVATEDIDNSNVTNAKLAQMAAGTIKGNAGAAAADPSDLTAAQARGVILESTSAVDAIADGDKIIIEDISAEAGSKTKHVLWSAIKAALRVRTTVTLTAAGWAGSPLTQSVAVSGLLAADDVTVSPAPASLEAYHAAGVYASAQAAGSITFTAGRDPLGALTVNVKIGR